MNRVGGIKTLLGLKYRAHKALWRWLVNVAARTGEGKKISLFLLFLSVLGCATTSSSGRGQELGSARVVFLVRHAEREYEGEDPPLTPVGIARTEALATTLRDARISAIITTELRRARDTAQPLAEALGIKPEIVSLGDYDTATHPQAVAAAVRRHNDENVLVVGHITVTGVIAALGGPRLPTICENVFSYLFLFTPGAGEDGLLRLRYGAAEDISPRCK
jgi:phosphohistidine phosphatase SixA